MKKIFNLIILSFVICLSMFTTSCSASPYGRFERISGMNIHRGDFQLFLLKDGKVLVLGGITAHTENGGYSTTIDNVTAEIFDPKTNTFTLKKGLNHRLLCYSATLLHNNKILITGGYIDPSMHIVFKTSEIYDPETDTVTKGPDMNSPRFYHTAILLKDGRVLIYGGSTGKIGPEAENKTAEIYDPVQNKFLPLKNAPVGIIDSSSIIQVLNDGTVCIVERYIYPGNHISFIKFQVEIFDPKTDEFKVIKSEILPKPEDVWGYSFQPAVKLKDDRIVIFADKNDFENEVSIYDYKKNELQIIGHMNNKRIHCPHEVTLLSDGNVLLTGGSVSTFDASKSLNTVELFDATTLKFYNLPKMTTQGGSSILLNDGRVLKLGGGSFSPWEHKKTGKLAEVFIPNKD